MKKIIPFLIVIILIVVAWWLGQRNGRRAINDKVYSIDSIKNEYNNKLKEYIKTNDSLELIVDSLISERDSIVVKYEVIYKDYGNPNIVSDDSVMRYIAKKIRNI